MIALIVSAGCAAKSMDTDTDAGSAGPNRSQDGGIPTEDAPPGETPTTPDELAVTLVPDGVTGTQRVNFAVPFSLGKLSDAGAIKILAGTTEVPAARRVLARYADGSARSVQLQVDVNVSTTTTLTLQLGVTGATGPTLVDVPTTLTGTGNNVHPKVWVQVPAVVLAASGFAGPVTPRTQVQTTSLDVWTTQCDYDQWDTDAFIANQSTGREGWLFDRVTSMYRGYAITGSTVPLRSAYREAAIYLAGMTISNGVTTGIAPPDANTDLKYFYSQGMALHYLMSGDDRYREAAEAVSAKVVSMWNPTYNGGTGFWTERHAGFALLAHEWATIVSDDKAAATAARAETAVSAYLAGQMTYPTNYSDPNARCFGHSATAHGEDYGTTGCSPWMSAILADALDAYARRVGGARATQAREAIVRLGRIIARDGLDASGKPFYWLGIGSASDVVDDYDEHWGEAAYIVGMAWDFSGRTDASLKQTADALVSGFTTKGEVAHVRSFNWQCRSAVLAPTFLK